MTRRALAGLIAAVAAVLLEACAGWTVRPVRVTDMTPAEAARFLKEPGAVAVDVSPWAEFDAGHLPGAVSVPFSQLWFKLGDLGEDKERPVLVYDSDGRRSWAAALMVKEEYNRVGHLPGGLRAWSAEGRPVERAAPSY